MLAKLRVRIHESYVLVGVASGVILTIAAAQLWNFIPLSELSSWPWLIVAVVLVVVSLAGASPATFLLSVLAGGLIANYRVNLDLMDQRYLESLIGKTITISGVITEDPSSTDMGYAFKLGNLRTGASLNAQDLSGDDSGSGAMSMSGVMYAQVEDVAFGEEIPIRSTGQTWLAWSEQRLEIGFWVCGKHFLKPPGRLLGRPPSTWD